VCDGTLETAGNHRRGMHIICMIVQSPGDVREERARECLPRPWDTPCLHKHEAHIRI
jgi:hypothetical protein